MASDDNVVRLKHIKSLAQTVTDEIANITLHGGGGSNAVLPYDADFALYVPNETSIIITGKQTPELAIGSWSYAGDIYAPPNSTKVYTAPVTYNGDGTLSTDNGTISNGVLTVHDTDGIFSGVISASAGNDFSSSSLYFNHSAENVTVDNDTDINNAIQSVGAKFVPAVDNADDFSAHANDNIQFFDNRLKKILDGGRDFVTQHCNSFLYGTTTINTLIADDNYFYLVSSKTDQGFSAYLHTSSNGYRSVDVFKLDERHGVVLNNIEKINDGYRYSLKNNYELFSFDKDTDSVQHNSSTANLFPYCSANSSIASSEGSREVDVLHAPNINTLFILGKASDNHNTYDRVTKIQYNKIQLANSNSSVASVMASRINLALPTIYGSLNKSTVTHSNYCDFANAYAPVISFNGQDVTISKDTSPKKIPILLFDSVRSNSTGQDTIGASYIYTACDRSSVSANCVHTSISAGDTITVNPWVEDDNSLILGLYYTKTYNDQYIITYKEGSYTKTNWLDNAFDVWRVEHNATLTKTTKKISDIADEIIL